MYLMLECLERIDVDARNTSLYGRSIPNFHFQLECARIGLLGMSRAGDNI
jgi:hypothetical protein